MKRIPVTLLWASSLLLLLPAASCTDTLGGDPDTDARAITFTPAAETRAAVETDFPNGSSFSVWGWYGTNDQITNNVFDGETVTKNGGAWTYGGGNRYWIAEMTYNFYGVYPVYPQTSSDNGTTASVAADGTITVTNFDCSKTGEEAVDLMTAIYTRTLSNPIEDDETSAVAMKFNHELARVNIIVATEEGMAYVTEAKLSGMFYKGTMTRTENISSWTKVVKTEDDNTPYQRTEQLEVDLKGITLLDEMLLIPQEIQSNTVQLTLTYNYGYTGSEKHSTAYLSPITWNAGQSYTYTLTIEADGRIHFASPTINTWGEALGGIIIVD